MRVHSGALPVRQTEGVRLERSIPELRTPPLASKWIASPAADITRVYIDQLKQRIEALDAEGIRSLVARGERVVSMSYVGKKGKIKARIGDEIPLALSRILPGQVQISFDLVRDKILELLEAIASSPPKDVINRFLAGERLRGFVSESGKDVLIVDGHHKLIALLALRGLVGASIFGGNFVPMLIKESQELFLERRDGTVATKPAKAFHKLEDNPHRKLVSDLEVKVRGTHDDFKLVGCDRPLVVKGTHAPEAFEFGLARIAETALKDRGLTWSFGVPFTDTMREVVRSAWLKHVHQETFALRGSGRQVLILPEDCTKDDLMRRLSIGRKKGKLRYGAIIAQHDAR